jgi:4-amino-4-deoxy-L-arabinose transferase-like glycosyltransferase
MKVDSAVARCAHAFVANGYVWWLLLLLPVALLLPALPIDETRYLAVAWEMRQRMDFLVPHLNGALYSQKPPLLFWLINVGWLVAGLHVWAVRLGVLLASFVSLALFERLVFRLEPDRALARRAVILLFGIVYFALFASAIMFDVLLATCVLLALHGALDMDAQRGRRGALLLALGIGLGVLTKGPVVLLDAGFVFLLGPWWSQTARENKARWYALTGLGVLGGALIALAWAVPAAISGGKEYADAIFVHQTVDRLAKSFAHQRPLWWYFMVLPLMLLPWTLAVRAPWRAWATAFNVSKAGRFAAAWMVPAFIAFCFVSGKQAHYLLPLLPAVALYLAKVLGASGARLRGRLFGVALILASACVAALPYLARHAADIAFLAQMQASGKLTAQFLNVIAGIWPLWGVLGMFLGLAVLCVPRAHTSLRVLALSSAAAVLLGMLMLAQSVGPSIDVRAAAARIKADLASGRPIAHLAWHHGLYEFAGRLTQPLPWVTYGQLREWCVAHPEGEVVAFASKYPITAKPVAQIPYRFGFIRFWRAADILTMPVAPVSPELQDADEDAED